MKYPEKVEIGDTTLRDGLQHEEHYITLEDRAYLLELLIHSGVRHLEVASLSHPVYLPQFRDVDRFLTEYLPKVPGVQDAEITILALNRKAVERLLKLLDSGVKVDRVLTGQIATSEAYARKNLNRSREELMVEAGENIRLLHEAGIKRVCASVGTIFGCPIQGEVPLETAYEFVGRLFDAGIDEIEHADPSGTATPDRIQEYFSNVMSRWPDPRRHLFHIHDIKGAGLLGYYTAMSEGIVNFECALGGIGGQPANMLDGVPIKGTGNYYFTSGRTGLVSTEDFVSVLEGTGIKTGIDSKALLFAGLETERILGRCLDSAVVASARSPQAFSGAH